MEIAAFAPHPTNDQMLGVELNHDLAARRTKGASIDDDAAVRLEPDSGPVGVTADHEARLRAMFVQQVPGEVRKGAPRIENMPDA